MRQRFLVDGNPAAAVSVLLAPGAGAARNAPWMAAAAGALADAGLRVGRYDFAYRAEGRRAPPRAERLVDEVAAAVDAWDGGGRIVVGGKSMGGRVASMAADALYGAGRIAGLLCLGYPFHPPKRPEATRTAHLLDLRTPTLICQGTRDPFGGRDAVAGYRLSPSVELVWLEDGDHDLKPRRRVTGLGQADHLRAVAAAAAAWAARLP